MAAYNTEAKHVAHGINESNHEVLEVVVQAAVANTDTLDVLLPVGFSNDLQPIAAVLVGVAATGVRTYGNIAITSHDCIKGFTKLTVGASGAAIGDTIAIHYAGITNTTAAIAGAQVAPYTRAAGAL